jgi:hypothetical protein
MQPFKDTIYLKGILHLLLVLYSGLFAPELPRQVLFLFKNQYFKLFIFSLILWTSQFSPSTAILISIAFMISMNAVNDRPLWEFLEDVGPVQQDVKGNAPVSSTQSVEALKVLAEASGSIGASSPADIATIANIVAANVTTEAGATALKQLAEQAIAPNQGDPKKIEEAITRVIQSIPSGAVSLVTPPAPPAAPTSEGCYPIRRYDISKVISSKPSDNSSNAVYEDYQAWVK